MRKRSDSHMARPRNRPGREPLSRGAVVNTIVALIDGSPGVSLHLADLCSAAGVSERTLRTVFRERFGMSPKKYLRMQKLQMVHRALRLADVGNVTVSSVAAKLGLSDAGRMARDYHDLFGEYPRTTLMHGPPKHQQSGPWSATLKRRP